MARPVHDDDGLAVDDDEPQPFHHWLEKHRRGEATDDWAVALADVLAGVRAHGKVGTLTITIHIEPKGRNVVVTDVLKAKVPTADPEAQIYFVDATGSLVRDDPGQMSVLTWRDAEEKSAPFGVDAETGEVTE